MPAHILVIEDNPTNLDLMVYLLTAFGYRPATAGDGEAGLAAARARPPDLVVCDVHLPRLDGYGVLAGMKADPRLAGVPVLAVTALAMVGDRDRMLAAGFDGYIAKPIDPEDFVPQVERYLRPGQRAGAPPAAAAACVPAVAARPMGAHRGSILVADDNPANLDFSRSVLEPSGYRVRATTQGAEALDLARREPPDAILCDLHMKPMDGLALMTEFKRLPALARVPFVLISATTLDPAERQACLKAGATAFLLRPIEPQALLDALADVLATAEP